MSAIILTAVLSCLNSAFYVCSRVLFVLAEHGDAPQWLVQVNARRVPTRSVWMAASPACSHTGGDHLLADGVRVPGERLRRAGGIHLHDHRPGTYPPAPRARGKRRTRARALDVAVPWLSYAALAGMAAVLIGMALTPGEMAQQLFWSVVSLAVAVGAFLVVDARRKARTVARTAPAAPGADGS